MQAVTVGIFGANEEKTSGDDRGASEEKTSRDDRYWSKMKEGGTFAANKAKLETSWKQEGYLKHMEMRSNVAGMGKDRVKDRLEKEQWVTYLFATWSLKRQFKAYVEVMGKWKIEAADMDRMQFEKVQIVYTFSTEIQ